jgi:hypothetical protein
LVEQIDQLILTFALGQLRVVPADRGVLDREVAVGGLADADDVFFVLDAPVGVRSGGHGQATVRIDQREPSIERRSRLGEGFRILIPRHWLSSAYFCARSGL